MTPFPTFAFADPAIDISFAICPKARHGSTIATAAITSSIKTNNKHHRRSWCLGPDRRNSIRTSFYQPASPPSSPSFSSASSSLNRSVTFADEIISEVICIPRYERASVRDLFYSPLDVAKFKKDYKRERMQFW